MSLINPPAAAKLLIDEALRIEPTVLVATSGGKDGNVVFDLIGKAKARFPKLRVGAFYRYFVDDLEPIERPIHLLCKRYGAPLFKYPTALLSRALAGSALRPTTLESFGAIQLKEKQIEFAARTEFACHLSGISKEQMFEREIKACPRCKGKGVDPEFGALCHQCYGRKQVTVRTPRFSMEKLVVDPAKLWVANGHRQTDSLMRRGMLSSFRAHKDDEGHQGQIGLDVRFRNLYPIAQWNTKDVYSYMTWNNLPHPAKLGDGVCTGAGLGAKSLAMIKLQFPACYARIVEEFPLAEAQLLRYETEMREAEEEYARSIGAKADEKDRVRAEKQAERAKKKAEKTASKTPGKKRKTMKGSDE